MSLLIHVTRLHVNFLQMQSRQLNTLLHKLQLYQKALHSWLHKQQMRVWCEAVYAFKLPATLVRTCMFSSSTARGSRYSAARPASTSASLLLTWLRRSRYNLHTDAGVNMDATHCYMTFLKQLPFEAKSQSYWSLRSVNCFSKLHISSRHSILLRSQSSSSISRTA